MYNEQTHLSKHFSKAEMTYSGTAVKYKIPNNPSPVQWGRIEQLVKNVLEPARVGLNSSITVNSGFRCKKLNEKVKGAFKSQHLADNGAAADIECLKLTNAKLFDYIKDNLDFDQLIWEFGTRVEPNWVHVSYVSKTKNRKQVLKCFKDSNNRTKYIPYEK